jgi:hypothetical protein
MSARSTSLAYPLYIKDSWLFFALYHYYIASFDPV